MTVSDADLTQIMGSAHTIAVVGLSDNPARPSYEVASYQQSQGYRIIPVNPNVNEVLGHKSVPSLSAVSDPVDIVDVFVRSDRVPQVVDDAIAKGVRTLWLQPGVRNEAAEQKAAAAGIQVIRDRCFAREHRRLLGRAPM
ncbi:CoA-binding protein [Alicyclobacillus shizuokensis]|uniref:CoA-binding protein n=1 Tax=Alicyclobacillus shizuokensis TaxID=392014 RepID=UPI000AA6514B|nr:CoA-binding protein [Alicyclobacillus shizuokensis]